MNPGHGWVGSRRSYLQLTATAALAAVGAGAAARTGPKPNWWLGRNLRVVTYEFLERSYRQNDLSPDEILAYIERLGGCDLLLLKGFHYWQGLFDDSSWGYPRFHSAAATLIPKLHARGIRAGVFGFTDSRRSYKEGPDHDRILAIWKEYARLGADILFVDEESGTSGVELPAACLEHCDEIRAASGLPVGLFLYGAASQADHVREATRHVDVIGEMGYELYLHGHGDYRLADLTRAWARAARSVPSHPVAYWTGALVWGGDGVDAARKGPGSGHWQERFGDRSLARYFEDYLKEALASGADGIFVHSICRLTGLAPREQAATAAAIRRFFVRKPAGDRPELAAPGSAPDR